MGMADRRTGRRTVISEQHAELHPVIALISVYAGLKLFGILGCVFAPIFVTIVLSVIRKEKQIPDFPGSEYKAEDISPSR